MKIKISNKNIRLILHTLGIFLILIVNGIEFLSLEFFATMTGILMIIYGVAIYG